VPKDKQVTVVNLLSRHTTDLEQEIKDARDTKTVEKKFSSFVNKILSTVEATGIDAERYKATRKLILGEIYGCRSIILSKLESKDN
jgi:hypothetical protein